MAAFTYEQYFRWLANKELGNNWESLATALGFNSSEIDTFKLDNHTTPNAIFCMLVKWKRKQPQGDQNAARLLINAFEFVERHDLVTDLKGK